MDENRTHSVPIYCITAQQPAMRAPGLMRAIRFFFGGRRWICSPRSRHTWAGINSTTPRRIDIILESSELSRSIHDDRGTLEQVL
jgi:hypothetical protein